MKRYQVYLNPYSVSTLDDLEKILGISRSKLIRGSLDRFAQALSRVVYAIKTGHNTKPTLDNLIGIIDLKTEKKTNYALREDEIFLED